MTKDFKYLVLTQHFQSSPSEKYWVARMWFISFRVSWVFIFKQNGIEKQHNIHLKKKSFNEVNKKINLIYWDFYIIEGSHKCQST